MKCGSACPALPCGKPYETCRFLTITAENAKNMHETGLFEKGGTKRFKQTLIKAVVFLRFRSEKSKKSNIPLEALQKKSAYKT